MIQLQKRVGLRKQLVTLHKDAAALDERHKALLMEHRKLQQAYERVQADHDLLLKVLLAAVRERQERRAVFGRARFTVDKARVEAETNGWSLRTDVVDGGGRVAVIAEQLPAAEDAGRQS